MPTKEEAQLAAKHLSNKTKLTWRVQDEGHNDFSVTFEAKQKMRPEEFELKMKQLGIDFKFDVQGNLEKKLFNIKVKLRNPSDVRAAAKNNFEYPRLTNSVLVDAVERLNEMMPSSFFKPFWDERLSQAKPIWFVNENEVSGSFPLNYHPHQVESEIRRLFEQNGMNFMHTFNVDPIKFSGGYSEKVTFTFSNPFDIVALSQASTKQEKIGECIVTPDMAAKIYVAVKNAGREKELNGLTNAKAPDKFARALNVLGVEVKEIQFNGTNGYKVKLNEENFKKIDNLAAQREENKQVFRKQ